MKVAVTGASGFCGAHVARRLVAEGHDVVGLSRRPSPVGEDRRWDAARAAPDLTGVDAVLHLAAAVGDPRPGTPERHFHAVNVAGTERLLAAAGERPVVVVSSSSVYDTRLDRTRITEDHPTAGQLNAYGRTKAAADRLALDAGAVVLRPRAVYGPGDVHLLPRLLRGVRRGRLPVPGPDVRISLTHVDNLATACLLALDWPAGAYNVADPAPVSRDEVLPRVLTAALRRPVRLLRLPVPAVNAAADLASAAARLTGREPLLTRYAVDELSSTVVLDTTRARAQGWVPADLLSAYVTALSR